MNDATRTVHAGRDPRFLGGLALPLFPSAVYAFDSLRTEIETFAGERAGYIYGRFEHPTGEAVEAHLAALQGTESAALFASGMAAICATALATCAPGGHLLACAELYGGTASLLGSVLPTLGVESSLVPMAEVERLRSHLRPTTRLIFVESPTNPLLNLVDLQSLLGNLGDDRPPIALDATLATPLGQDTTGIDLVLHSATKYLGGHDDLTAGVVMGSPDRIDPIRLLRRSLGSNVDPFSAWMLGRGLKTLDVRWQRQCANALELAGRLERHPAVERVFHPGLPGHPQHELARRQMRTFGALLAFEVRGGLAEATRVHDAFQLVQRAPSLGGVETVTLHPATASHRGLSEAERDALGIRPGLLRLSVGIEDPEDLWNDVEHALSSVA